MATKSIIEKSHVKYSDLYEDYEDEYIRSTRYLDLDREDFCCDEMHNALLGEGDGKCELCFGYEPITREYFIDVRFEYGGAVRPIKHCFWCGKKFSKELRSEGFDVLEKEYNIKTDILEWRKRTDIPPEFKTDEWGKKRKL